MLARCALSTALSRARLLAAAPPPPLRPRPPARRLPCPSRRASASASATAVTMAAAEPEAYCFPRASRGLAALAPPGAAAAPATPLELVAQAGHAPWLEAQPAGVRAWAAATGYAGQPGEVCLLPAPGGGLGRVVAAVEDLSDLWAYAALPAKLPPGTYALGGGGEPVDAAHADAAALGWALGAYSFERYKSPKEGAPAGGAAPRALLEWPAGADRASVAALAEATFLARDMITTPAEDMAPADLAAEAAALAAAHGATLAVVVGDDLLAAGYPAIHTVGRAAAAAPRLIDLRWAPPGADAAALPQVALVGKGVTFDSGGLDIKPAAGMKLMKKDMGGGALVLALAHAVMAAGLPISLRVLVPAVENAISGNAFRPLDVLATRAGISVENGNTDAEGRLILADALTEAAASGAELILDAATLTGAARVALGTELPALFCDDDAVAEGILAAGRAAGDPLWRLPLHAPYRRMLDSKVADLSSTGEGGYAGAITAALFLHEFVKAQKKGGGAAWAHVDTMGYNLASKPGRPEGGEAFALRALFGYLRGRYGQ